MVVFRDARFLFLYIGDVVNGIVEPRCVVVDVEYLDYYRRCVGKLVVKDSIHQPIFLHHDNHTAGSTHGSYGDF